MPGRHEQRPASGLGLRWMAGAVGLGIAVAATGILAIAPAHASGATVNAQLSLSGVATKDNILGGTTVGVHPGDTVDFKASALPTAGLANVPTLGPVLSDVLNVLLGQYQVVLTTATNFPGGARTIALGGPTSGPCKGAAQLPVTFANAGTYKFHWKVQYVLPVLLSCSKSGLNNTDLNLLKSAGVAINATNQWTGQIVAAVNPPPGGISIQLPGVSVAPSLPVVGQLPTVGLPGTTVTLPTLPGLPGSGGGKTTAPGGGKTTPGGLHYTPPPLTVPERAMGGIGGGGSGGFGGVLPDAGGSTQLGTGLPGVLVANPANPLPTTGARAKPQTSTKRIDLASNKAPAAQLPVLLAIIAIIALSLVTATYARLFLLRRNV